MQLLLEQLFYGRSDGGYGILAASPNGSPFARRVEALCGAVGTSGTDYGGEPFLISAPEGESIIMVCGRRGASDGMGRATLLFHAFIAKKSDLAAAKADAFTLYDQGAFAERMPSEAIAPLTIEAHGRDASTKPLSGGRIVDASLPCVFRSAHPSVELVRAAVGERVNDLAWATFAFHAMPDFDVQVLPQRVAALQSASEYDSSGKLLRTAKPHTSRESVRQNAPPHQPSNKPDVRPSGNQSSPMLKLSLTANAVLAVLCIALYSGRKPPETIRVEVPVEKVVEKKVEVPLSAERKAKIEKIAIGNYKKQLAGCFPDNDRIEDFKADKAALPKADDIENDSKYSSAKDFLRKAEAYVNFVNTNFFTSTSTPNTENYNP